MSSDSFKHRRRSIRLRDYDYSQGGAYFITICEVNRECIFGDIVDGVMRPNHFGGIVLKWWNALPNYYPPVELDEFVVMPNHMHGIIVITDVGAGSSRPINSTSRPIAGRHDAAPTERRTLGQLVGYFKFQITKEINQIREAGYTRVFQRDYYEHIIRNEREWNAIGKYILDNPANWRADMDNPRNFAKHRLPRTSDGYWNNVGL